MKKPFFVALTVLMTFIGVMFCQNIYAQDANQTAYKNIIKGLSNELEGNFSNAQQVNLTTTANSSVVVYDKPPPSLFTNITNNTNQTVLHESLVNVKSVTGPHQTANIPANTIDNNLNTYWASDIKNKPNTITFTLNDTWKITAVGIAFFKGTTRTATVDIGAPGQNGEFFISNGKTNNLQNFTLSDPIESNQVMITGYGNSVNEWNSLTEVKFYGYVNHTGPILPPSCGPDAHLENGQCVPNNPPPPICNPGEHLEGNQCVPNPVDCGDNSVYDNSLQKCVCVAGFEENNNGACVPIVPPNHNITKTKVDLVGDLNCGGKVDDALRKDNPAVLVTLGDLCYKSTLSLFKQTYGDFRAAGKLDCMIGNHEADNENGNAALEKETRAYCGDHYYQKIANGTTLLLVFNTNGDAATQRDWARSIVLNAQIMNGVKNVIEATHKPYVTPPNSHHNVESVAKAIFPQVETAIPEGVNIYRVAGHNHVMAASSNAHYFISGAGGDSHYSCGTSQDWPMCNNKVYGFLQMTIDEGNGAITSKFIDTSNNIVTK